MTLLGPRLTFLILFPVSFASHETRSRLPDYDPRGGSREAGGSSSSERRANDSSPLQFKDRFIDRELNELVRIEKMMEPFPAEVDYNNISIEHVMLKEEQKRLRGHVERGAFSQGLPNPLEGELYLATKSTSKQQPMSTKTH